MTCVGLNIKVLPHMVQRYGDSYLDGIRAEKLFEIAARERHSDVREATVHENRSKHIDFFMDSKGVDVKAKKKLSRSGSAMSDGVWLELQGRNGPGWLFGSAADFIAFEIDADITPTSTEAVTVSSDHVLSSFRPRFLIVDRSELETWVRSLELSEVCKNPSDAWYRIYSRDTDQVTIVSLSDIIANVKHVEWC